VLDSHGDIGASAGGPDGLFNADTRYLADWNLVLGRRSSRCCSVRTCATTIPH